MNTAERAVVYGRTLPGPIWEAFMNAALKGTPGEDFSPYEPMGTAAYANNGGGSSYGQPPVTATNSDEGDSSDNGDSEKKKEKKKKRDNNDDSDNALLIPPSDFARLGRSGG